MRQTKPFDIEPMAYLSDEAFVHHCFVRFHRRVCNPQRARYYLVMLASGITRGTVARSIFKEVEYTHQINTAALRKLLLLDGEVFLREAYKRILGRPIDNSGLQHYSERLSKGEKKLRILYDLATSSEGRARWALYPELGDFVNFLTRANGLLDPITLKDIVSLVALKNDEFVQKAYRAFLKREVDADGLAAYQQALRSGCSKIRILHALAYSNEGRGFQKTLPVRLCLMLGRVV